MRFYGDKAKADAVYKGVEPLTPDDIAEVVVFAAGRRENVVLAETLIFPNHQVSPDELLSTAKSAGRFFQADPLPFVGKGLCNSHASKVLRSLALGADSIEKIMTWEICSFIGPAAGMEGLMYRKPTL